MREGIFRGFQPHWKGILFFKIQARNAVTLEWARLEIHIVLFVAPLTVLVRNLSQVLRDTRLLFHGHNPTIKAHAMVNVTG